jgi:SRSO17 transposase
MNLRREAIVTVSFVDEYCAAYQHLFPEVRSFQYFKYLHLGMISQLKRKTLPAITRTVGIKNSQPFHHFLANSPWDVEAVREQRMQLLKRILQDREFILCIEDAGDRKKGSKTDYLARQYISNLGRNENGIVTINAYGVLELITFPLTFKIFKPASRLKEKDIYKTKPQLAIEIINELLEMELKFQIVMADSFYGESDDFIELLNHHQFKFIVAIRNTQRIVMLPFCDFRYNKWKKITVNSNHEEQEFYYIRQIIFSTRQSIRYWQITNDPAEMPEKYTWFVKTNLSGNIEKSIGNTYTLKTWLEYGFKQHLNELGWADYRLTEYPAIEKWWEIVYSASLMLSLRSSFFLSR